MSETMPDPVLLAEVNPDPEYWRGQLDQYAATLYQIRADLVRAGVHDDPVDVTELVRVLIRQRDQEREAHRITRSELDEHVSALDSIRATCERAGIPEETTDEHGTTRRWSTPHLVERLAEQLALVDKMLIDQIRAACWPERGDLQAAPESPTTQAGTGSKGDRRDLLHAKLAEVRRYAQCADDEGRLCDMTHARAEEYRLREELRDLVRAGRPSA